MLYTSNGDQLKQPESERVRRLIKRKWGDKLSAQHEAKMLAGRGARRGRLVGGSLARGRLAGAVIMIHSLAIVLSRTAQASGSSGVSFGAQLRPSDEHDGPARHIKAEGRALVRLSAQFDDEQEQD